jgi:hypothetical protein
MILVVGRPGLSPTKGIAGTAGRVAQAAAEAGAPVEIVGSVGDDAAGDGVVIALGRAGIGHAALMRDPTAATPTGEGRDAALPRLDASDLELGLRYLADCRVLVLAEPVAPEVRSVAADAAAYHGAALIVILGADGEAAVGMPPEATQLQSPPADDGSFADLVGRYAAALDGGRPPSDAWQEALAAVPWQETSG